MLLKAQSLSWLDDDPEFSAAVDAALDRQLNDAIVKSAGVELSSILPETIQTIKETVRNPRAKIRAKLAAVRLAWDIVLKLKALKAPVKSGPVPDVPAEVTFSWLPQEERQTSNSEATENTEDSTRAA